MPILRPTSIQLLAVIAALAMLIMITFPAESLHAAERGVAIWWDILFPALFPFLVISEMMLGFGIVHFFGTLLDPVMRPLFRIPGIGGFVMAVGFASGYPVGARLTAKLWEQGLVTREEGERLVSFTTSSDPIFLIGAVAVGFFGDVGLAVILAAAHYGAAVLLGLLMRFHGRRASPSPVSKASSGKPLLLRSLSAMHWARLADGRPVGLLLQQAIRSSLSLIFVIGGLVVFFSVVLEVLRVSGVMDMLQTASSALLTLCGLPSSLSEAVLNGIFEVTLGAKAAGHADGGTLEAKVAVAAFVLSWAGLSVHAQIISLLQHTNMRYTPFAFARLLHGLLATALVLVLWDPLQSMTGKSAAALQAWAPMNRGGIAGFTWLWSLPASFLLFVLLLTVITLMSSFTAAFSKYRRDQTTR